METLQQLNKIQLRGIVGSVKLTNIGEKSVARFTLATSLAYRGQDGCAVIETTWHTVVAWEGKDIHDLGKLERGDRVEIIGRLRNQRYTTSDGEDRYTTEILAQRLSILDGMEALTYETR